MNTYRKHPLCMNLERHMCLAFDGCSGNEPQRSLSVVNFPDLCLSVILCKELVASFISFTGSQDAGNSSSYFVDKREESMLWSEVSLEFVRGSEHRRKLTLKLFCFHSWSDFSVNSSGKKSDKWNIGPPTLLCSCCRTLILWSPKIFKKKPQFAQNYSNFVP